MEENNGQMYDYIPIYGLLANGLTGRSGTWKQHDWKFCGKVIWGKGMWTDLSILEKDVKVFVPHVNCLPKADFRRGGL